MAEILVNGDTFRVDAATSKLRDQLTLALESALASKLITHTRPITEVVPGTGRKSYLHVEMPVSPSDKSFLEAIRRSSPLWAGKRFAGYRIDPDKSRVTPD